MEGSSRAVLGQQVRFKVDKLKELLEGGASEAEVTLTAAYVEVRVDYPGKYEPAAVTAKKRGRDTPGRWGEVTHLGAFGCCASGGAAPYANRRDGRSLSSGGTKNVRRRNTRTGCYAPHSLLVTS